MNLAQNYSQFVKTSSKSRYKGRNGLFPIYVNHSEEVKNVFQRNSQGRVKKQNSQAIKSSRTKEGLIQKIPLTRLSTIASTFNKKNLSSHRAIFSNQKFRSTSQSSIFNFQSNNSTPRPCTQFKNHRNFETKQRFEVYTPLQVIKTKFQEDKVSSQNGVNIVLGQILQKLKKQQNLLEWTERTSIQSQRKNIKSNFLKKGASLDRNLFHNILKSKLRSKLVYSSQSYSNRLPNTLLYSRIKQKIPNEFRDFIGPEQMLQMTRILSGIKLKSTEMNDQIQTAITRRQMKSKIKTSTSQGNDLQTLKSIKRW